MNKSDRNWSMADVSAKRVTRRVAVAGGRIRVGAEAFERDFGQLLPIPEERVIAADDGPMPQSREHLQILELIGVRRGTVALTKCDRATPEQLEAARAGTEALIRGSCLDGAEIIETAVPTGMGIDALKTRLRSSARSAISTGAKQPPTTSVNCRMSPVATSNA